MKQKNNPKLISFFSDMLSAGEIHGKAQLFYLLEDNSEALGHVKEADADTLSQAKAYKEMFSSWFNPICEPENNPYWLSLWWCMCLRSVRAPL